MNFIFVLFVLILSENQEVEQPSHKEIRHLYERAVTEEESCRKLMELLAPFKQPLLSGYRASATMLMAKHVFNPFSKMKYFKKGKKMLEEAILADKDNVELRMLRFLAQSNIPSFLGYNDHLESDKEFLLNSIPKMQESEAKDYIISKLATSKELSDKEIKQLKQGSKKMKQQ